MYSDIFNDGKEEYIVRETTAFAYKIGGATMDDEDGRHNIYINANLPADKKLEALQHEIRHNQCGHIQDDTKSVEEKEAETKIK